MNAGQHDGKDNLLLVLADAGAPGLFLAGVVFLPQHGVLHLRRERPGHLHHVRRLTALRSAPLMQPLGVRGKPLDALQVLGNKIRSVKHGRTP